MTQRARPNTVVMQYMVLFSQRTVLLPSVVLSQKQEAAVCKPAPAGSMRHSMRHNTSVLGLHGKYMCYIDQTWYDVKVHGVHTIASSLSVYVGKPSIGCFPS